MKTLSPEFQSHLDSGVTTLCWCWRLSRRDGTVFGFTDHDEAVTFDAIDHRPTAGFTATALASNLGLSVDDVEVEGALVDDILTEEDLAAGLFDGAGIGVYRVNWASPDQHVLMRSGTLGEVERSGAAFRAELRGLTHALQQPSGRVFQSSCDAELGDARCGVNLESGAFKGTGQIVESLGDGLHRVNGLGGFDAGWFSGGTLTMTGGVAAGAVYRIRTHERNPDGDLIALWETPGIALATNDPFAARAGCDKTFQTCRERFSNGLRFRGFPHIPGNDFVLGYPRIGAAENTGGSRNG